MKKRLILTSFHYHQRLCRSKLCFTSTKGRVFSSVVYQNVIILHTGNAEQAPFYFSTALLPLKCELQTPQACIPTLTTPSPTRPVLLLFAMFYSFFLSTSYFIYCSLPDTRTFIISLFHSALCPLTLLFTISPPEMSPSGVRQIPDIPGSGLMTAKER